MQTPMLTRKFWEAAGERAAKTFAQTFIATALASGVFDVFNADWMTVLGTSLGATILSLATSILGTQVGDPESPAVQPLSPEEIPGGPVGPGEPVTSESTPTDSGL